MKKTFLISLALAGCAFSETTLVYVGTGADGIYSLKLDEETGALTERAHVVKGKGMGFQELRSDGKILFSAMEVDQGGGVASFQVKGDGLSPISSQSYDGRGLCHVSLGGAESSVLFGADYGGGKVVSFPVAADGSIGKLASLFNHEGSSVNKQRQEKPHAHSIYAGPENRFAYAPDLGIDKVKFYTFDSKSGQMKDEGGFDVPAGSGCRHMKFGKNGDVAYVLNELTLTISTFSRDGESGRLTLLETVSVLPAGVSAEQMTCSEIRVSKDGKFLYTANRDLTEAKRDSVSVLKVGDKGIPVHVQSVPAEVWIPRNINLSPSGDWLLVAGQNSNEVTSLKVDKTTGKLTFSGHRAEVPAAMCINFRK
jgi:6-phosphogluconolactonase